ncbi:Ubiquinone/menaquinone biosynthesis methyltransferase UbiE [Georgfuchsia toluolica]|uniref:Ubiquinone/menaquinone biosynthesis methyltransferase UbiE n=1 Tax=Georgfuchsia toluolica TaxID=424218 RepID=A0A916MZ24_9PROT|nr:class I SAM-dependent methyltransferase [Georgfuchsia toluolica]CAG4882484.1 Ubiquinone/menaquinone biosynthesis methyltransferase UbiE [Georgfuchsia toluolica]
MEQQHEATLALTQEIFGQKESKRRSLFSNVWARMVPEVFKDVPRYYRSGNIIASLGLWELWVWQFLRTIKLRPHYQTLDVCAGTNDVGIRLLKKEPAISVTAIDRSKEMQEEGQRRAKRAGLGISSVIHDVHDLPFPDNSFDVITLQAASRHLQLDKVLPEILRVLKPGGVFYHCDMLKPTSPLVEWLYLRFLRISVFMTSLIFGSTPASRECCGYFSDAIHHFYTPEELTSVLQLIGFSNVSCKKSIWGGMVGFHAAQKPLLSQH